MFERYKKFSVLVSEIHRYMLKIQADIMKRYGLSGASARLLLALFHNKELTAAALSKELDKNRAEISRTVADLEERGLVERVKGETNYRVLLRLTKEGEVAATTITEFTTKAVSYAGSCLSEDERELLYKALDLISENLQTISKEGIPEQFPQIGG